MLCGMLFNRGAKRQLIVLLAVIVIAILRIAVSKPATRTVPRSFFVIFLTMA